MTAANNGIENCPHSKAIDEVIIENAFLEMLQLLAENSDLEKKRKKLTDMYLYDKISTEAYDDKYSELNRKLEMCGLSKEKIEC